MTKIGNIAPYCNVDYCFSECYNNFIQIHSFHAYENARRCMYIVSCT